MIEIHSSNRIERLAEHLGRWLAEHPPADPMAPLWVLVPSRGMERFLGDHLAMASGISAGVRHAFPARIVRALLRSALDDAPLDLDREESDPWDPDSLTWAILEELPALRDQAEFQDLTRYLERMDARGHEVRREEYHLARMAANLLDEVAAYRPEWARAWSRGDPLPLQGPDGPVDEENARALWQRTLWQALERRLGPHPLSSLPEGTARLGDPRPIEGLPERLALFGISALPPSFLEVLLALGRRADITVRLDLLTATRGYVGDHPTARQARQIRNDAPGTPEEDLHLLHPLVESFGGMQIEFLGRLQRRLGDDLPEDLCEDPVSEDAPPSQLRVLQQQMLDGVLQSQGTREATPDGTLVFHSAHTLARQVQILRDEILAAMDRDPTLQPRDFLVMCADVEATAPLVQAIFGMEQDRKGRLKVHDPGPDLPRIPVGIADMRPRDANPVAHAALQLMKLARGRFRAGEVLDFLALNPVCEKAGLDHDDIDRLSLLLEDAGARHGVDEGHRAADGLPAERRFTWEHALDRLVFGAASSSWAPPDPIFGIAPRLLEDPEDSRRVGLFAAFFETLREACARIRGAPFHEPCTPERTARSPARWLEDLSDAVPSVVAITEKRSWQWEQVLAALADLSSTPAGEPDARPLDLWTLEAWLEAALESGVRVHGLLQGGINFAGLVPMRTIPFRVVALLGLDEENFPRKGHRASFDLLGLHPAPGDRNPRSEDRLLLLEALLSARDRLWVFWNGRGVRDNQDRPLPVPLEEMLDVIVRTFVGDDVSAEARERFIVRHRMQPFHPDGFVEGPHRSYDARMLPGARALIGPRSDPRAFLPPEEPLRAGESDEQPVLPLRDLERALRNPARFLVERRLRARLERQSSTRLEMDPLDESQIGLWDLMDRLQDWLQDGVIDFEGIKSRLMALPELPSGVPGEQAVRSLWSQALVLHEAAKEVRRGAPRRCAVDITYQEPRVRLTGSVPRLYDGGLLLIVPEEPGAGTLLRLWLRHLAVSAMGPHPEGQPTFVFYPEPVLWKDKRKVYERAGQYRFEGIPREKARSVLQQLLEVAIQASRGPVPLFPGSSYQYVETRRKSDVRTKALDAARRKWKGQEHESASCDIQDPYVARVFGDAEPWGEEGSEPTADPLPAEKLAIQVYGPILEARQAVSQEQPGGDDA